LGAGAGLAGQAFRAPRFKEVGRLERRAGRHVRSHAAAPHPARPRCLRHKQSKQPRQGRGGVGACRVGAPSSAVQPTATSSVAVPSAYAPGWIQPACQCVVLSLATGWYQPRAQRLSWRSCPLGGGSDWRRWAGQRRRSGRPRQHREACRHHASQMVMRHATRHVGGGRGEPGFLLERAAALVTRADGLAPRCRAHTPSASLAAARLRPGVPSRAAHKICAHADEQYRWSDQNSSRSLWPAHHRRRACALGLSLCAVERCSLHRRRARGRRARGSAVTRVMVRVFSLECRYNGVMKRGKQLKDRNL